MKIFCTKKTKSCYALQPNSTG